MTTEQEHLLRETNALTTLVEVTSIFRRGKAPCHGANDTDCVSFDDCELLRWKERNLINGRTHNWIWRVEIVAIGFPCSAASKLNLLSVITSKLWQFPDSLIWHRSYLEISRPKPPQTFPSARRHRSWFLLLQLLTSSISYKHEKAQINFGRSSCQTEQKAIHHVHSSHYVKKLDSRIHELEMSAARLLRTKLELRLILCWRAVWRACGVVHGWLLGNMVDRFSFVNTKWQIFGLEAAFWAVWNAR